MSEMPPQGPPQVESLPAKGETYYTPELLEELAEILSPALKEAERLTRWVETSKPSHTTALLGLLTTLKNQIVRKPAEYAAENLVPGFARQNAEADLKTYQSILSTLLPAETEQPAG